MMPKVDTFEHDISDEIRRKDASLTEISAASNNVGNNEELDPPKQLPIFFIAIGVFSLLILIGFGILGYFYFSTDTATPDVQPISTQEKTKASIASLEKISPTLANGIGQFISGVEKKDQGYVITITDYSSVFAYMIRNENSYIEELVELFPPRTASTTPVGEKIVEQTTPVVATTTATTTKASPAAQSVATSTATTTKAVKSAKTATILSTTTKQLTTTSTPELPPTPEPIAAPLVKVPISGFSDVTLSNQNMRVYRKDTSYVVYAFVGSKYVVISGTEEGVLTLKSAILK